MVSTILILALAIVTLVLAWSLLSRKSRASDSTNCEEKRHEIDIQILRSLLDPHEFDYLHSSLSRQNFQNVLRKRIRLTLTMLRLLEENAKVSMEVEPVPMAKNRSGLARPGDELVASMVQLRLNLLLARVCLWLQWLFPSSASLLSEWIQPYQHLLHCLEHHGLHQS